MSEGKILMVTSVAFLGGLSSLWLVGSRLDRLGSKPVLTFAFLAWLATLSASLVQLKVGRLTARDLREVEKRVRIALDL